MSIYLQHGLIFLDVPETPLALIPGMNNDRGGVTLHPRSEVGAESNCVLCVCVCLQTGFVESLAFPSAFASNPKYFQTALLLLSLSTSRGGESSSIFKTTRKSRCRSGRGRGGGVNSSVCGCWGGGGGVATKYRYYGKDRYCGKLVLKPFLILSIGKYRSIDIFDNTTREQDTRL